MINDGLPAANYLEAFFKWLRYYYNIQTAELMILRCEVR